jgi:starvation-inducible DNA-binding protein
MSKNVKNALRKVLADTFMLAVNTQAAHWNVVGPNFESLHELFGDQYQELDKATDELAERLRALGELAPAGLVEMAAYASVKDGLGKGKAEAMLKALVSAHETATKVLREAIEAADEADDDVSEDMLIQRLGEQQKMLWMLRSSLEK